MTGATNAGGPGDGLLGLPGSSGGRGAIPEPERSRRRLLDLEHGGPRAAVLIVAPPGGCNRRRWERQREAPAAGRRPGPREAARAARQGRLDGQ
jgi:hypothetical protein